MTRRRIRLTRLIRIAALAGMTAWILSLPRPSAMALAQTAPARRAAVWPHVLALHSYHADFSWTAALMQGMDETLKAAYPGLELSIEYMDTKRYSSALDGPYIRRLKALYAMKYGERPVDVILSSDDNAFQFLLAFHTELFPGVPIVFCGVNHFDDSMLTGHAHITGLLEVLDLAPTLDLALQLQPDADEVAVISDSTPTGIGNRRALEALQPRYADRVRFRFLSDDVGESLSAMLAAVSRLDAQTIIIFLDFFRDGAGAYHSVEEVSPAFSASAPVPIYTHTDLYLPGVLGGKVNSGRYHGQAAAERAVRILQGVPADTIPLHRKGLNKYIFDYTQVERFGIRMSQLPEDSIIINKPFSVYEEYTALVWSIAAIIALLIVIALIVIKDNILRKRAETEIRHLNASLEARVKRRTTALETVNRELNDFAYIVSHDLKAPLRGIAQLTQWLVHDYADKFDEQGREMADLLVARVKRMDSLINGVLQYSRAAKARASVEQIDLNCLLPEIVDSLSPPEHVHITLASDLPCIHADITRITQVFQNLLSNAIKFIDKPRGEISLECAAGDMEWIFRVADNGPGIDPAHHDRIFQIFQTVDARRPAGPYQNEESTGVGLSIVKKILEGYGGSIQVESTIGRGATFVFTFPRTVDHPCPKTAPLPSNLPPSGTMPAESAPPGKYA